MLPLYHILSDSGTKEKVAAPVMHTVPLVVFQVCSSDTKRFFTVIGQVLPLIFGRYFVTLLAPPLLGLTHLPIPSDVTIFVLVIVQVRLIRRGCRGVSGSTIVDVINRDAEIYFVVITTYNFVAVVMLCTVKVRFYALRVQVLRVLTLRFAFLVDHTRRTCDVNRPRTHCRSCFFTNYLLFSVGRGNMV